MYVHWSEGRAKVRTLVGSVRAAEPVVLAEFDASPVPFTRMESRMTRTQQLRRLRSLGIPEDALRDAAFIYMRWEDTAAGVTSRYTTEKREWRS